MNVAILNADRNRIWSADFVKPGVDKAVTVRMNENSGGTYYIKVAKVEYDHQGRGPGSYSINLSWQNQNDGGLDADAPQELVDSLTIEADQPISGEIGHFDEADAYRFEAPNGAIVAVTFTVESGGTMNAFLFNPDQDTIWSEELVEAGVIKTGRRLLNNAAGGTYYFKVAQAEYDHQGRGPGVYNFTLSLQNQNDAASGSDAGGEPVKGLDIQVGQAITGEVGDADEFDCYKFTLVAGQTVSFTPGEETNGMGIQVFNADLEDI